MNGTLKMYDFKQFPPKPSQPVWSYYMTRSFSPHGKLNAWATQLGVVSDCGKFCILENGDMVTLKEGEHFVNKKDAITAACEELQELRNGLFDTISQLMDQERETCKVNES